MTPLTLSLWAWVALLLALAGLFLFFRLVAVLVQIHEMLLQLRLTQEEGSRTVRAGLDQLRETYEHWNRPN